MCAAVDFAFDLGIAHGFGVGPLLNIVKFLLRSFHTDPEDVATLARRFPRVQIIMAHLSHPYEGECVVTIRKHPNVYADCSALHYRPFQLYHSLMLVQEYGVWDKVLFGTDYPFTTVKASLEGMRGLNGMLEGTMLPRLNMDKMERMFERDTLGVLGITA